jgi:hypothetical protein
MYHLAARAPCRPSPGSSVLFRPKRNLSYVSASIYTRHDLARLWRCRQQDAEKQNLVTLSDPERSMP